MSSVNHAVQGYFGEGSKAVSLNLEQGLSSLVYYETVYGSSSFTLKALCPDWFVWDEIARGASTRSLLRWGVVSDVGMIWSDWRYVVFNSGKIKYTRQYAETEVEGTDWGYLINEKFPKRIFKNTEISSMVSSIANDYGISSEVEKTQGKFDLCQTHLSDAQFIEKLCLPRAFSTKGKGDYVFYFRDGSTLVFRTPEIKSPRVSLEFGKSSPFISNVAFGDVEVNFNRLFLPSTLSWNTEFVSFHPIEKRELVFPVNDNSGCHHKFADKGPNYKEFTKEKSAFGVVSEPGSENYLESNFKNQAKATWCKNHRNRFTIELPCSPIIDIRPGDTVLIAITDSNGNDHFLSGLWFVHGVKQKIQKVEMSTVLYLSRRETR